MRRDLDVTAPGSEPVKTFFSVGIPEMQQSNYWSCEVWIGELFSSPKKAFGVDSWHALQMGIYMIYKELELREKFGWKFSWFNGEESDIKNLFPPSE